MYATLPITDVLAIKFGPQFHGYANHLLTVALDEPAIYTALAIIPCRRLWPWIGAKINETSVSISLTFLLLIFGILHV